MRAVLLGVAIGVVPGVLLGRAAANELVDALESDLVHLVRTTNSTTTIVAVIVVAGIVFFTALSIALRGRRPRARRGPATRTIVVSGPLEIRVRS